MMFSTEKCSDRSMGTSQETELQTGGGEGLGKEGVPPDEVASAVAAVSDEIGDILKDELGDADRADRIGAELAGLSAELGLLAGLADGEQQQDFPSLFEIAIGHRVSGSGTSSSSSWSGGGARRASRPQRAPRRRPIAKGKEISRRRSAAARRAASMRMRRVEVVSDASDVGADSDSDGQWTELEDACSSDNSSSKEPPPSSDAACNGYQHKGAEAEAPAMGQFLLPLLSADPEPERDHLFIRHEDILQAVRLAPLHLLTSGEEGARIDMPNEDEEPLEQTDDLSEEYGEEPPVTPEEEAALLDYVCEAERLASSLAPEQFAPVEEWLLGVYHAWCEISALMYTLIGANMSVEMVREDWLYRARFGCHCRLCLCLANSPEALARCLRVLLSALARGSSTIPTAAALVRALRARGPGAPCRPATWRLARLRRLRVPADGLAIIHEQLLKLETESEMAHEIVNKVCLCRPVDAPLHKLNAMERLCNILENFKAASTITFQVEIIPSEGPEAAAWAREWRARLQRYLAPFQRCSTAARLRDMMARPTPKDLSAWTGYRHKCDCLTPRAVCAQQRKLLLRISFFGMMQAVNEFNGDKPEAGESVEAEKAPNGEPVEAGSRELQQGDGTGAKPPDSSEGQPATPDKNEDSDSKSTGDLDDLSDSEGGSGSLGLSSSSLDSASELLLCAAAAVESGSEDAAPGSLCRTVRHLMRSIASIERLMDRVLKHCDEFPVAPRCRRDVDAADDTRKRVDMGLSEVDRKLMAMYRRLPEVHRRQLQVYRKQKKLSTVCMQLVGGRAPAPPPPGSPPPAPAHQACRALCPEYHLQRFQEVRRKVMHMRDQQLYYHRLRMWLEEQLRYERERERDSMPENNVTLVDDIPRRKRRSTSPKQRLGAAPKRKLKPPTKPQRILQMLKHRTPAQSLEALRLDDEKEADPPEAFPLERDDVSDAETIVGEKDTDLCKEMKECLVKFANFALNSLDTSLQQEYRVEVNELPDSVSPPLQEMSPTTSESMPVYTPKPNQRLLHVNKFLARDDVIDFQSQITPEILNVPLNARRTPILVEEEDKCIKIEADTKDPNVYKYVTFGLEIKKAMEECQNIINSYNSINREEGKEGEQDGPLSLEQICEVMMSLDKNSAEFLDKIDSEKPIDINSANTKLVELVENMPQILANMPEIATKLSEFANASFELPEFASIMNSLPEVNSESQLTPDTVRQIRELKLSKNKDSVKVTKHTAKRKSSRRVKSSVDHEDIIGTMTIELDNKDITELLKDENDMQALTKNKSNNKEDFKDLLFSISAQVVINKVFEYLKQNKSPELAKCLEEDKDFFNVSKNSINSEMYSKASMLFDNSVKDALSMSDLRELVKARFNSWKHYVATKYKGVPVELLENEIEAMLEKFYTYIQDLAGKQNDHDSDKIIERIEEMNDGSKSESDSDSYPASKESLKQISKLLSTSAGNTFDLLIMKLSKMSQDKKTSVKSLKFKYMDVVKRCAESLQLSGWILLNPEIASNVIEELTGIPGKNKENVPDFHSMPEEGKKEYFIDRLKEMSKTYMSTLPKDALSGDEWLVMLYRLEKLEENIKESFTQYSLGPKNPAIQVTEAEILAAKGLSKIIDKINARVAKKANQEPKPKKEDRAEAKAKAKETEDDKKSKNEALLAKCEAILTFKGEKSLLDSFYTIKSYITQGLPVPKTYKKHVISICSSIDAKLLDDDVQETLKLEDDETKEKTPLSVIGSQNPELLAKYSAQALRNAKQTLNAVAFRNMMRNGQTKSESDACDTPKTDCKWTNDCVCSSCKDNDAGGTVCLGDIVNKCCDVDGKSKSGLEEKKKEVKPAKPPAKAKPPPKACENASHQQHVCKVGHSNGASACAGDGAADQPCTCCYCTVFGHAPPLTTPVPRNYNETRERLRSILNKKKQKSNTANGEPEPAPKPAAALEQPPKPKAVSAPPAPKPPALPKTLPPASPALTATQMQAQLKRQAEQRLADKMADKVADKMADMTVSDRDKPKALQRTIPIQVNVPPALKAEGKVNPNAMEQIRLQQVKQQAGHAAASPAAQAHAKPEPIYDLPVHNKPALTPQQHQQIRQQQLHQQQQQQQQQHHHQQQQQQQLMQQLQQKRMSRPAQARAHASLSSRDTSVFSTSSGCSGVTSHSGSCWRISSSHQDPRDLDALLQYIEGPARHVDRGKKRAKKQRQKAKRLEARLVLEHAGLSSLLSRMRTELRAFQARQAALSRQCDEAKAQLRQHQPKRKGKKQKLNPAQQAQAQLIAEHFGEINTLLAITAKEVSNAEGQVAECAARFEECERQLAAARALQGAAHTHLEAATMLHRQQLAHLATSDKMDKQKQKAFINAHARRPLEPAPAQVLHNGRHLTVLNACATATPAAAPAPAPAPAKPAEPAPARKQTWEQALAHINQLAKGTNKEKKKPKEPEKPAKVEAKQKEPQRSQSLPDCQPLSKKQRKLLAKQQAEEEERKRQQQLQKQEAKSKQTKKPEPPKVEPQKADKKDAKKEDKKEKKKQEKGKENKLEKSAPAPATKQKQQPSKKEKKERNAKQVINITADTTIEDVSKTGGCGGEPGAPSSCSIMEQLSCGVQVSDLRLPPGITLTRVQPNDKKESAPIKSVPLWKAGALAAAPTPVARPAPVINADPSAMMFSAAHPEQPKTVIIPEPAPPQHGRSKKAKKKAKKAAAAAVTEPKTDGTKMVTLRNPMFHPNLPPAANPVKKPEIRIPDPIPMPPNACQATITPTSNGMYTIRNPLMSMMHQQSLMGVSQPQMPMYGQQYNYVNPNAYTPVQTAPNPPQAYVLDPSRNSPKQDDLQNRIMKLASFTQKNEEGYSLFKTNEDNQQRSFLSPEYYAENSNPKPVVSPNPIGTRPTNDCNRSFDSNDSSLFTNPVRPEPIGTPLKQENDYAGLYTPFGQEDRNVFRNALFNDKNEPSYGSYDDVVNHMVNGDPLPYFQRLRVGSKLNNEVTIHHVTESKFYKGQELCGERDESLFARAWPASCRDPPEGARRSPDGYGPVARPAHTHAAHHE